MRSKEEIQAKLDSLMGKQGFEATTQRFYLALGLEKSEEDIKHLIWQYDMRIRHEKWELAEDKVIFDTLSWVKGETDTLRDPQPLNFDEIFK